MADLKISQLTSATLPLAGTEVLPIVQSSSTKKVATDDLTVKNVRSNATTGILQVAGPAAAATRTMTVPDANFTAARTDAAQSFTGDQTLGTGNLIQGTAGRGINFTANTNAPGMTSELLNWYEEGTWTPEYAFSGGGTAPSTNKTGYYTRIGRLVTVNFYIYTDSLSSPSGNATISGLPFTSANLSVNLSGGSIFEVRRFATDMPNLKIGVTQNSAVITIYKQATNSSSQTPLNATDFNATAAQNLLCGTIAYLAA